MFNLQYLLMKSCLTRLDRLEAARRHALDGGWAGARLNYYTKKRAPTKYSNTLSIVIRHYFLYAHPLT